ncbi:tryptophan synthase subunit alpha [Sphaerisporangium corydalis]|uniref:Tryptophan synthase alpha chain n=1 Tax=Sphaerisporangium corydalis TaxID=1441875 RepID=A0ABV9E9C1_9ACTN|nr:tryptophan synthase subunit alpha [Sphaerisporangium corydalis]
MTTLQTAFEKARADKRAALVGYLPAGFPTKDGAVAAATAMVEAGCDVIEIGLPYSDPLMDGPTIQDAVHRALSNGTRIADVMRTVEAVARSGAAVLVMTYWNPIDRYGAERFARDLANAGGRGTITPDLTPEEAGPWCELSAAANIDTVFLVAPSSPDERIQAVADCCTGFVYAASLMGVTGARASVGAAAEGLVARTRAHTGLPVCVGLGVGTGAQAAEVAGYADGVIVGSAFIRRLLDAPDEASGLKAVRELAAELAAGVRG